MRCGTNHISERCSADHVVQNAVRKEEYLINMSSADSRERVFHRFEAGVQVVVRNELVSLSSMRFARPIEHFDPRRQVANLRGKVGQSREGKVLFAHGLHWIAQSANRHRHVGAERVLDRPEEAVDEVR